HLGAEGGEGEGDGPHERLVGAGGALRDHQVGRVRRVGVAVAFAAVVVAGVVVAVLGVDVDVVAAVLPGEQLEALRRTVRVPRVAAAHRRRGGGRGVAEGDVRPRVQRQRPVTAGA